MLTGRIPQQASSPTNATPCLASTTAAATPPPVGEAQPVPPAGSREQAAGVGEGVLALQVLVQARKRALSRRKVGARATSRIAASPILHSCRRCRCLHEGAWMGS